MSSVKSITFQADPSKIVYNEQNKTWSISGLYITMPPEQSQAGNSAANVSPTGLVLSTSNLPVIIGLIAEISNTISINLGIDSNGILTANFTNKFPYKAVTGNYQIQLTDCIIECTGVTFDVTLPDATTCKGQFFSISNTGGGSITLNTLDGQTIMGESTQSIVDGSALAVVSNGTNYIFLA